MQFARVATRQGIVGRRQLLSWGFEHLRYRLRGTTDERTAEVLRVARDLIRGVPERTITRMGPEVMAALRNLAVGLLRSVGVANIAEALRRNAARVDDLFAKLGILKL